MRRSNYLLLPAEIRGNLLAIGVYDTKAHWLILTTRQTFHLSGDCLQNRAADPHLYFSGHLLASLASVWNGRKITALPIYICKSNEPSLVSDIPPKYPGRWVSIITIHLELIRLCFMVSVVDRAENSALPTFSPFGIQPPARCLVRM